MKTRHRESHAARSLKSIGMWQLARHPKFLAHVLILAQRRAHVIAMRRLDVECFIGQGRKLAPTLAHDRITIFVRDFDGAHIRTGTNDNCHIP
jgi:hypothetical protein